MWNCDESGAQANKNGEGIIFARRGTKSVHTIVSNKRLWLSILVVVNSVKQTMPNFYVFKGKKPKEEIISFCEDRACMRMQES